MTGALTTAARILSLMADGRLDEASAVVDEAVRGDDARETMLALAGFATVTSRLLAERMGVTVDQILMEGVD